MWWSQWAFLVVDRAAGGVVGVSMLIGAAMLLLLESVLPHEHFIKGREGRDDGGRLQLYVALFLRLCCTIFPKACH